MKVDLSGEELNVWGYDKDNGQGAATRAINSLKLTKQIDSDLVRKVHTSNARDSARDVKSHLVDKTTYKNGIMHLRLGDFAETLNRKVDESLRRLRESEQ